jgi:ion channel-forming bestrophin family protein
MQLMHPFGEIIAGISLNQIERTIEINLLQMLGEKEIPAPVQPVDNAYILQWMGSMVKTVCNFVSLTT